MKNEELEFFCYHLQLKLISRSSVDLLNLYLKSTLTIFFFPSQRKDKQNSMYISFSVKNTQKISRNNEIQALSFMQCQTFTNIFLKNGYRRSKNTSEQIKK